MNLTRLNALLGDNKLKWSERLNISRYHLQQRLDGKVSFKELELEVIAEFFHMEKKDLI